MKSRGGRSKADCRISLFMNVSSYNDDYTIFYDKIYKGDDKAYDSLDKSSDFHFQVQVDFRD